MPLWLAIIPFSLIGLGIKSAVDEVQQFMGRDGNTQAPPPPPPAPLPVAPSLLGEVNPVVAVGAIALAFTAGVFLLGRASK